MVDDIFIEEVKSRINIIDIVSSYVELKGSNDSYKGLCPFHNEKSPSFMVNEKKQMYKCFGCGEGGDVIAFVMKKENLDFIDALKYLAQKSNISWPEYTITQEQRDNVYMKEKILQIHLHCARYYFQLLWNNIDGSLEYIRNRNLSDKTIKKFGLGYAPKKSSLRQILFDKGYKDEELLESGLFVYRANKIRDRFFGRIMFPIFDIRGKVIAFGGRVIDSSLPKYLNSSDTKIFHKKDNLYGINIAKNCNDNIILVEGYMDVIALHHNGFTNAVASLGTSLTKEQSLLIKKYTKNVYLAYDNDDAGIMATLRAINILKQINLNTYIIDFISYKDPDEFLKMNTAEEFQKNISISKSAIQFEIEQIQKKYNLHIESDRLIFIKESANILKKHYSPTEVEREIIRLSKITNLSIKSIGSEIYGKYFSPKQFHNDNSNNFEAEKLIIKKDDDLWLSTELFFLYSLMHNPSELNVVKNMINNEDFVNDESKEIFTLLLNNASIDVVKERFKGKNIKQEGALIGQLYNLMIVIKKNSIKIRINNLLDEQQSLSNDDDLSQSKIIEIGMKVMDLTKELDDL